MKKMIFIALVAIAVCSMNLAVAQMTATKHNLASSSANAIKSTNLDDLCSFCHTPHAGTNPATNGPLWNKDFAPVPSYTMYATTIGGNAPTALGPSTLACLSCHDGASAINAMYNVPGSGLNGTIGADPTMQGLGAGNTMPAGITNVGTNLTNDHPVGIIYDTTAPIAASLRATAYTFPTAWLGATTIADVLRGTPKNQVECGSCHDPHNNTNTMFLRASNAASALCLGCHSK